MPLFNNDLAKKTKLMSDAQTNFELQSLILSEKELYLITGYKKPQLQLQELKRQGFYRARQSQRTGSIILERAHYDAICRGSSEIKPKRELIYRPSR
jgi:hypothetical protein